MNITSVDDNPLKHIKMASVRQNACKHHIHAYGTEQLCKQAGSFYFLRSVSFEHSAPYGTDSAILNILVQQTDLFLFS